MTEQVYSQPLASFEVDAIPAPVKTIPVLAEGRAALEAINAEMGLAFDEQDLEYYLRLFRDDFKRDPTTVELFDIGQSNSEHSRHWFFGAKLVIDGEEMPTSLFKMVKEPLAANPSNSVIGFHDNSSAIRGGPVSVIRPAVPGSPSPVRPITRDLDLLLTAETHNFPCAVAPYPGAETGAGGRMRDTHATGIGSIMGVGSAGYCTGNLNLPEWPIPGEDPSFAYPDSLASPEQILIDASNGASDYGNKFGEPLVLGYTRTFGQRLPCGERREWLKPIMFSAGMGQIDHAHLEKEPPAPGMLICKIGGPAYRIGMGGGAASSLASGSNKAELDFNAVQRGDAEMSQKLWRVVRACVEMGDSNPIVSLHDQGAGGNCNVVKEIVYPCGGEVDVRAVKLGDETLSVLEIWGAEYQENDCLLLRPEHRSVMEEICARERCALQIIGSVTDSGRIVVKDSAAPESPPAVDLDLEAVLGDMPQKTYSFTRAQKERLPLELGDTGVADALDAVLKQPAVCSKRFLTTKVDRSVSGLVAQQQCVGPMLLPVADCAVMAQSHSELVGLATSIGEAPLKGLINHAAMARLAVGEALTNLMWAKVTSLGDVKSSVNWMHAAKMGSEGVDMYDAAVALRDVMIDLGIAIDGGKDSLSMAAAAREPSPAHLS
jgi:phosphoribosylformylglycinamidine synthase